MKRIAILGMGSIGTTIVEEWQIAPPPECELVAVMVRESRRDAVRALVPSGIVVVSSVEAMLQTRPDVVIEAAGQPAVVTHGEAILRGGSDLMVISVGALADPVVRDRLVAAAQASGRGLLMPVGGIAGLDGLRAMVRSGPTVVTYTSIKPPLSWLGTPAEDNFNLPDMNKRTVIFTGSAGDAALLYPRNANLAAAVALAGTGLDETKVELVADPDVDGLLGIINADAETGSMRVEVLGKMSRANNKTSSVVGVSAIAALINDHACLRYV